MITDTDYALMDTVIEAADIGHADIAKTMIDTAAPDFAFADICYKYIGFLQFRDAALSPCDGAFYRSIHVGTPSLSVWRTAWRACTRYHAEIGALGWQHVDPALEVTKCA